MYRQVLDPVAHSLAFSSLVAALPLVTLFVLLGGVRMKAWMASLVALAVSFVIATAVYGMPVSQASLAATEGAAFGLFPILWVVINAIWVYTMTVQTGYFDVLRRSFAKVSDDQCVQAIVIAFCFGALMEALAGFGTPVAITSVMLIALGFPPMRAAALALTANTAPVAFGAIAVPITTLAAITGLPTDTLGAMVGRQTPILAIVVPLVLVFIVAGREGVRRNWAPALVTGVAFGLAQWLTSNYISVSLTDIVAALFSAAALVAFLRVWQPGASYRLAYGIPPQPAVAAGPAPGPTPTAGPYVRRAGAPPPAGAPAVAGVPAGGGAGPAREAAGEAAGEAVDPPGQVVRAYAPYVLIILVFVVAQVGGVKSALDDVTRTFNWPGLHVTSASGKRLGLVDFKLNWLSAAGSLMLIAGFATMAALAVSPLRALRAYAATLVQLRWAILTVMAVLALAFVMNTSGQTFTLGTWMAGAGGVFALLSPVLGWLGTAVTGSDTSSNSLFGGLQVTAADQAGLSDVLMAASNSSGGVLGKMISPQNLAIAAAAVGLNGQEGDIFRRVVGWSLVFLLGMCLLVVLQSTAVLSWMVP